MISKITKSITLGLLIVLGMSTFVAAGSLTQGYHSNAPLSLGSVVSVTNGGSTEVELTNSENENLSTGVVVNAKDAIVDLQPKGSDVRVAISGMVTVLVTDIAGNIKTGDSLIISPLAGIAMKDNKTTQAKKYIAVAKTEFNSKSSGARQISVDETNGGKKDVHVGPIEATLLLSDRPAIDTKKNQSILAAIGEKITGKPVSTARVILSAAILLVTFAVTGFLLNGTIKGSFQSLGRNPLAKSSIMSSLAKVVSVSLIIFATGLAASYVILQL